MALKRGRARHFLTALRVVVLLVLPLVFLAGCGAGPELPFVSLEAATGQHPEVKALAPDSTVVKEPDETSVSTGLAGPSTKPGTAAPETVRVGVAPILSPEESYGQYEPLVTYLAKRLQRPAELVEAPSYADMNAWVRQGRVELALVCSEPYVDGHADFGMQLLAVPVIQGSEVYHSDVIVRSESPYTSLSDLRGSVFAYVDPMSFSGRLAAEALLLEAGYDPRRFFKRVIYTSSHDNSIRAVAGGLVDGAAVDSHVLETFLGQHPAYRSRIRIIASSMSAGNPPFVTGHEVDPALRQELQEALLQMDQDADGRAALRAMGVDRFVRPSDQLYDSVRQVEQLLKGRH